MHLPVGETFCQSQHDSSNCHILEEDVGRHEVLQEVSRGKKCDGYHQVEEGVKESAVVMVGVIESGVVALVLVRSLKRP